MMRLIIRVAMSYFHECYGMTFLFPNISLCLLSINEGSSSRDVTKRVRGWIKNLLSYGDRKVFLKAVAQALPIYEASMALITQSQSLVSHVFYSKYFARTNVFDARFGDKPSYA
ncbi:hypothetical protein V6N13_122554 [Hibiscus sabdariffa]